MGKHNGHSGSSGGSNHGHRSGSSLGGSHHGKPSGGSLGGSHHSKPTHHRSGNGASVTAGLVLGVLASDSHPHCHSSTVHHSHNDYGYDARQERLERERRERLAAENQKLAIERALLRQGIESNRRQEEERERREKEEARRQLLASHQSLLPTTTVFYGIPECLNVMTLRSLNPLSASMPVSVPVIRGTQQTLPYLALQFENKELFSEVINNKGYPLNLTSHALFNPLFFITTMVNGVEYLELVKAKVTPAEVDFLVNAIYNQVSSTRSISPPQMAILNWLLINKSALESHSDKFNYFAKIGYAFDADFSTRVFSSRWGNFAGIDEVTRCNILFSIKPDRIKLLEWYHGNDVFHAQKLCADLPLVMPATKATDDYILDLMGDAVSKNARFETLELAWLDRLVENYESNCIILEHLIHTQPEMVTSVLSELKRANQMKLICIAPHIVPQKKFIDIFNNLSNSDLSQTAYSAISTKMLSVKDKSKKQENILARERILLAFVAAQFKKVDKVDYILSFANTYEYEWKKNGSYMSPRATEAMLKLAKNEILTRLKDKSAGPTKDVANFMAKNRTTHHFLCMTYQLTWFSTSSTKAYNFFNRDKFAAAVDKEVERGEAEFRAVMGAR